MVEESADLYSWRARRSRSVARAACESDALILSMHFVGTVPRPRLTLGFREACMREMYRGLETAPTLGRLAPSSITQERALARALMEQLTEEKNAACCRSGLQTAISAPRISGWLHGLSKSRPGDRSYSAIRVVASSITRRPDSPAFTTASSMSTSST